MKLFNDRFIGWPSRNVPPTRHAGSASVPEILTVGGAPSKRGDDDNNDTVVDVVAAAADDDDDDCVDDAFEYKFE